MKILIMSLHQEGNGLAYQMGLESNEVAVFSKKSSKSLSGMAKRFETVKEAILWQPEAIVFTYNGDWGIADDFRKKGFNVIYGSKFDNSIDSLNDLTSDICRSVGILVPQTVVCDSMKDVIEYSSARKKCRFVYNQLHFISQEPDLIENKLKSSGYIDGENIIVRDYIPGVCLSTVQFFVNGKPFLNPIGYLESSVDYLAPSNLMFWYGVKEPKIVGKTIRKLGLFFEKCGYTGPVTIKSVISEYDKNPYLIEIFTGFNGDVLPYLSKTCNINVTDFVVGLQKIGQNVMAPAFFYRFGITIPPYPYSTSCMDGTVVKVQRGIDFFPKDCYTYGEIYKCPGETGHIGDIIASGKNVDSAHESAVQSFKTIKLIQKQANVKKFSNMFSKLENDGYLTRQFLWN